MYIYYEEDHIPVMQKEVVMEPLIIRPIQQFRSAMHITWLLVVIPVAAALLLPALFIPDTEGQIAFTIILAVFIAVMIPVAVWIPFYQRSLVYEVTPKHVIMEAGVFWKRRATVPYTKVTNVDTTQGPLGRYFGFGTVHVQTAGAGGAQGGHAEVRLAGVKDFVKLKDIILSLAAESDDHSPKPAADIPVTTDTELLGKIHRELVAIRNAVEQRNG